MIANFFANHPSVYAALLFCYSVFEYWIAKTNTTRAGSLIELIVLALNWRKKPVTIVDKTQSVAKETQEVFTAACALARDWKAGIKPQDIAAKEFSTLMQAVTDSDQIPAERIANPEVFAATVGAGIAQLVQILLGAPPKA